MSNIEWSKVLVSDDILELRMALYKARDEIRQLNLGIDTAHQRRHMVETSCDEWRDMYRDLWRQCAGEETCERG